jgi:hypothetical protein
MGAIMVIISRLYILAYRAFCLAHHVQDVYAALSADNRVKRRCKEPIEPV